MCTFFFGWGKVSHKEERKMNKQELAGNIAKKLEIPYTTAYDLTTVFTEAMFEGLLNDGFLRFVDWFTLYVATSKRKKVMNIRKNEPMIMEPFRTLRVNTGKKLKKKLREKGDNDNESIKGTCSKNDAAGVNEV